VENTRGMTHETNKVPKRHNKSFERDGSYLAAPQFIVRRRIKHASKEFRK
jgi:hypothetical protein